MTQNAYDRFAGRRQCRREKPDRLTEAAYRAGFRDGVARVILAVRSAVTFGGLCDWSERVARWADSPTQGPDPPPGP